jgi:hypothetical protein
VKAEAVGGAGADVVIDAKRTLRRDTKGGARGTREMCPLSVGASGVEPAWRPAGDVTALPAVASAPGPGSGK